MMTDTLIKLGIQSFGYAAFAVLAKLVLLLCSLDLPGGPN